MAVDNRLRLISSALISIPTDRQRRTISEDYIQELKDSFLKPAGLLNPIIIRKDLSSRDNYILVAGECRLLAWKQIESMPDIISSKFKKGIPCRFVCDLSEDELFDLEFEENYRRKNLDWQDESLAFMMHYNRQQRAYEAELIEVLDENENRDEWPDEVSFAHAAGRIGTSQRHYRRMVIVGRKVQEKDPQVLSCDSARAAGALLERRMQRVMENELATFGEVEDEISSDLDSLKGPSNKDLDDLELELNDEEEPIKAPKYSILNMSFTEFIVSWSNNNQKFNFVHCDFPFGKGLHKSDLYRTNRKDMIYEDTENIYWLCCDNLIEAKKAGILSNSCHIMFWFPMNLYTKTFEFFKKHEFRIEPYPLVWIKSDKMGLIPDPTRGPRRIYETAFIMSLGDRKVIKSTVNGCWCDSGKRSSALHASSKPAEMLSDFCRMFIDSDSVVLDPTCGSGTALEVALMQKAKFVVGLDINPKCTEHALERVQAAQNQLIRGG